MFDVCEEWVDQTSIYFNVKVCEIYQMQGVEMLYLSGAPHNLVRNGTIVAVRGARSGVWFGIYDVCKLMCAIVVTTGKPT